MAQTFEVKLDEYVAPMKAVAELTLSNFEKIVSLNTEVYTKYSNLMLENFRTAMTVTDIDAAKVYAEQANVNAKAVVDSLLEDGKTYADLSKDYATDVQKLVTTEVEKVTKKAA